MSDGAVTLRVQEIGVRGDGIAEHAGERVFLPLTAPGDVVRARLGERRGEGRSAEVLGFEAQAARAAPRCPHFGACGGCAVQHLTQAAYVEAKTGWLAAALRHHGLAAEIRPLRSSACRHPPPRAVSADAGAARSKAAVEIGFQARASHRIVDLQMCAVLHPSLMALVAPLRRLAPQLLAPGERGAATATLGDSGVDLLLDLAAPPALAGFEALADFARGQDLARLAWRAPGAAPSPVAQNRAPHIAFGGVAVDLPDEIFLQASADADAALTGEVLAALDDAPQMIADLFAGIGTFSLPLVRQARVHAVERDEPALAARRGGRPRRPRAPPDLRAPRPRRPPSHPGRSSPASMLCCSDPPRAGAGQGAVGRARQVGGPPGRRRLLQPPPASPATPAPR